jgi:preprotein translocase subunit SecF
MEWIKPGTKFDFMGKRKLFLGISIAAVSISVVAMLVFGLNFGVDFKGGSVVVAGFKTTADVDRDEIAQVVADKVKAVIGRSDVEVTVQDFAMGGMTASESVKFQLYTDVTSLVSKEKTDALAAELTKAFGANTRVETPDEGDKFFVALEAEASVQDTQKKITELFGAQGFQRIKVRSDREEQADVDFYKELNLVEAEKKKAGENVEDELVAKVKAFREKKERDILPSLKDSKYTVTIHELSNLFDEALRERFKDDFLGVESSTAVSASVGKGIFYEGMLAMLYAILGIMAYVAMRFDVRFAPGAVVALVHDATITMGFFAVFQLKFSMTIVAALLTIIGFSVNDTIVIFDRIRENIEKTKGALTDRIINRSVNETLSRTFLTTGTVVLVDLALLILGGDVLFTFALALMIGFAVGTYSSVFVASPVAYYLDRYFARKAGKESAEESPASAV